jgi:hypothetical protein
MKLAFSPQIFEKHRNIKFHENASSGGRAVPSGRTKKNMTKLMVTFRNPVNEFKTTFVFPILSAFHSPNFASQSHYKYLKLMLSYKITSSSFFQSMTFLATEVNENRHFSGYSMAIVSLYLLLLFNLILYKKVIDKTILFQ